MGIAAHRAQERIDLEVRRLRDLTQAAAEEAALLHGCANISGAVVDLKAFRRDGDFLT
jgi:hypothetical protein